MKKFLPLVLTLALFCAPLAAQTAAPAKPQAARRLDLAEYGVQFTLEPRLVVVMAALDAAGFDPAPGKPVSPFRARVRADQANLDADLRANMRRFYERHRLMEPATPAQQAARYVSLAFALGSPPAFEAPAPTDDLFEGVVDVLDFTPLVRDFYRRSGIEERLPAYLAEYRAEAQRLAPATTAMVRATLNYLHTRPVTTAVERVAVRAPAAADRKKKGAQPVFTTREHDRRFLVVPDLLAAPGAINFRIVADDYYVVLPPGTAPDSPEVRRAYLQFIVDPLIIRFNRDIALKRAEVRALLDERAKASPAVALPDVFEAVGRSIVAAADARMTTQARLAELSARAQSRLAAAKEQERVALTKEVQDERALVEDELSAQLADAYERGAVLAFYFAEQLRDLETAGFDFADSLPDLISRIDVEREKRRPAEYAAARVKVAAARERALKASSANTAGTADAARHAELIRQLDDVSRMLRARNYPDAKERLLALMHDYRGEPRIFFALAQAESIGAADAVNEETRDARLASALANYRNAIQAADRATDLALISRAYAAMGRILAFLERNDEARQAFDEAIKLGDIPGGSYADAIDGRKKLQP